MQVGIEIRRNLPREAKSGMNTECIFCFCIKAAECNGFVIIIQIAEIGFSPSLSQIFFIKFGYRNITKELHKTAILNDPGIDLLL